MGLQQIAKVQGESVVFIHMDHLGSASAITDQSGNGVGTYIYEPYGQVLSHTGVDTEYKFTGKEDSSQTGLYYFGARYYDPRIGRFITQDPARDGANWYAYCANNPLNRIDPDGLMDDDIALGLVKQMATSATAAAVVVTTAQVVGQVITEKLMEFAGAVKDTASNVLKNLAGSSGSYGDPNNDDPGKNNKGTGKDNPTPEVKYPGNDPAKAPGKGWEWRGKGEPGTKGGSWYNPKTKETFSPDLNHLEPIKPHWDYKDPSTKQWWRVFSDGTIQPK